MEENSSIILEEELNEINIFEEVIQSIAAHTISDTEGAALATSIADGFVEKLVKKANNKGIRISIDEKNVSIDVHIVVVYGTKIPDICANLQDSIKKSIENVTDLIITDVNIYVDGVIIEKDAALDNSTENSAD